jgi:signal transduction histidine kinase/CheY-like chemotaxis protein/tetratricopeptide (TPR) repeat protein
MDLPRPRTDTENGSRRGGDLERRHVRIRELGSGALACVELVRDRVDDALYARKSIPLAEEERLGVLRREYRLRNRLAHPQVPGAHVLGRDGDRAVLVLEYAEGVELVEAVRALGAERVPLLLAQALHVVGWLHQRQVLHGDLKPENLCISGCDGSGGAPVLRLLDFGTAIDLAAGEAEWRGGTPAYLAPYLKDGGAPGPVSDLYALGRSFQEALEALDAEAPGTAVLLEGLGPVLGRLTHGDPDLAFGTAEDALLALAEHFYLGLAELPFPREAPFAGRSAERALLAARREALQAGLLRENLIVVRGATGTGKSRLLTEFAHECVLAGVEVVRLRCERSAGTLEPVLELVDRLLPGEHAEHERLAQAVAPSQGQRGDSSEPGAGGISQRYLRDLARTVKNHGAGQPCVVLIDDVEAADEPTLSFLRLFGRIGAPRGPLVVAALGTELEGYVPAAQLVAPGESTEVVQLEPLPPSAMRELLTELVPRRLADDAPVDEWVTWSEGNPSMAVALVEAYVSDRRVDAGEEGGLFRRLMERRLESLDAEERRLLAVLSLLERATPVSILLELADLSEAALQNALDRLVASGLAWAEVHRNGRRFRVASATLASYLAAGLGAEESRALHARALEAWGAWPFPFERPADMLARHAIAAGLAEDAIALGTTAVDELLAKGSLRSAEEIIRDVLPLVGADDTALRGELLTSLADVCLRTGRPGEARRVLAELDVQEAPGDDGADLRVRVLRLLGTAAEAEGDQDEAYAVLERGRDALHEQTPVGERRRLLERLGVVLWRRGRFDEARATWEEGLGAGLQDDRDLAKSELLNDLGVLDWNQGELESSLARHEAALEIRRELGDLDGESRSLLNLANVAVWRGELEDAGDFYEESLRIKRLVGTVPAQALTLRNLAGLYQKRGEFRKAIACVEESVELRERVGERLGEAAVRRFLGLLLLTKGELPRARAELDRARSVFDELGTRGPELAMLHKAEAIFAQETGAPERAAALASAGLEELGETAHSTLRSELLRIRSTARVEEGDLAGALEDAREAQAESRRGEDRWELGWNGLTLARALLAGGDEAGAREELERTLEHARAMGAPQLLTEALLTAFDLGETGLAPERAIAHLIEAERTASRLGIPTTQLRAWLRMGRHAYRCGFVTRAAQWWRKAVQILEGISSELTDEERAAFLGRPESRAIQCALAAVLGRQDFELSAMHAPEPREGVAPAELLAQSEGFIAPAADTSAGSLRPEVLRRLLEISRAVNGLHHREEIMAYLRDRLEELFGAENSQIVLVGRDGGFRLMGESEESTQMEISHTVLERVLSEGAPVLIQDTSHDPELFDKKSVHRLGLTSVLCAPLIVDGETIGIIQFDHRSKPEPFTEEDLSVLALFAHQAATALKNMLLLERLDETIERLRSSEAQLVAGERLRALGEMSAGVAHDFNNLLTIIVGITDLMRANKRLPGDVLRDIDTLETVSQTAAATVRRLQEFRGGGHRRSTRIDPVRVVRQSAELGRRRFLGTKRHQIEVEASEVPEILGHESELREVLLNLIINAIEAMPEGGRVTVRAHVDDGSAVIEVADEGTGIPPELARRVFEPFYSTKQHGQGMGLSISLGIVKRMHGTIVAENGREGRGTVFRLRFPAASPSEAEEVPSLAAQAELSGSHVLVVDDDPVVREVICRMLDAAGFRAVGSGDGQEALTLFERERFDLVLTDYAMPEMDGGQVAREIKRMRSDCPVVLLTGLSPTVFGQEVPTVPGLASQGPFNLVLRKPITTAKLAEALHLSRN